MRYSYRYGHPFRVRAGGRGMTATPIKFMGKQFASMAAAAGHFWFVAVAHVAIREGAKRRMFDLLSTGIAGPQTMRGVPRDAP